MSDHSQGTPISGFRLRVSCIGFWLRALLCGLVTSLVLQPNLLRACAACYGQSDSPMAKGMNWGIFSLLAVIVGVLGGVAAFFVYLARRSATLAAESAAAPLLASTGAAWPHQRSASVLGCSGLRRLRGIWAFRPAVRVGARCARRGAHSGSAALGGGIRGVGPVSTGSVL
jgi:hypothetical protein